MRYAAFLLPLRRELKFGEVGGGGSRARRTLPRRGKPCQGQGKVNCEGLNLQETDGSYVCCKCEVVIDTKKYGTKNNKEAEHEK